MRTVFNESKILVFIKALVGRRPWSTYGNSPSHPPPSPKTSNGPIRAKHITQLSTVIGRCGSMGLYSMGSHWSQSTWARLADRFYSTSVHFPCTQISQVFVWLSLVEISKCEETPFYKWGDIVNKSASVHLNSRKCKEAGINSCVTVPSKVCASQVSTKTLEWPGWLKCTEGGLFGLRAGILSSVILL